MAGKGRASVNDMKRVEVLVLMEIARQSKGNGVPYGFSRKTLSECVGVSPYRARAAIDRLDSDALSRSFLVITMMAASLQTAYA